jgi:hypothetical protein
MAVSRGRTWLREGRGAPPWPSRRSAGAALSEKVGDPGHAARRRAAHLLLACAVGMVPWTVGLTVTLPHRYVVDTWTVTWTGFDVALIICFSVTAWALRKQRQVALLAAMVTSVLLICDAWFDLLTAHRGGDLLVSTATALFGEIPLAIFLAGISTRLLRATMPIDQGSEVDTPVRSLWRAPLIAAANRSDLCRPQLARRRARRR